MDFTGDYTPTIDVEFYDYATASNPWDISPQTWEAGSVACCYEITNSLKIITWGETRLLVSNADTEKYLNPRSWLDFWQERNLPRSKELDATRQQLAIAKGQIDNLKEKIKQRETDARTDALLIDSLKKEVAESKRPCVPKKKTDARQKKTDARYGSATTGYLYQRKKGDKLIWEYRYQEKNYYVSVGRYKRIKEAISEGTLGDKILKEIFNK